jgi:hypothetical protein
MRKSGNFFLCLLINLFFHLDGTIPAWILLVLHYLLDLPIWLFWLALGIWLLSIVFWMGVIGWATQCSDTPDPPKENKNPYSVKKTEIPDKTE